MNISLNVLIISLGCCIASHANGLTLTALNETWESSPFVSLVPKEGWDQPPANFDTSGHFIKGDSGYWNISDTAGEFGVSPNRVEVIEHNNSKALRLVSNEENYGATNNVWVDIIDLLSDFDNRFTGIEIPVRQATNIKFRQHGTISNGNAGDFIHLSIVFNNSNVLHYVTQRHVDFELPNILVGEAVLLSTSGGDYYQNIYEDYEFKIGAVPNGLEIREIALANGFASATGWSIWDNIEIGEGLSPPVVGVWYADAANLGGDWRWFSWLGYFNVANDPWIYHLEHGYQYCIGADTSSYFFYDFTMQSWFRTSAQLYPYMYKFGTNEGWYWYYEGAEIGKRWFIRVADGVDLPEAQINDPVTNPEPFGMVLVEGGTLSTSNSLDGTVVETFYIGSYEATWGEWQEVRTWAASNGYDIGSRGDGCAEDHPVHSVNWFDVLKWCNAKSEMEGLMPVYSYNGSTFKQTEPDHTAISQNLSTSGYRLPQEAEWEFAARGGNQTNGYTYAGSNDLDAVGWYFDNSGGAACDMWSGRGTWPMGQKAANELGLYYMSGNVWEWCWDRYSSTSSYRLIRGGSWEDYASGCTVSRRGDESPDSRSDGFGFRVARSSGN